MFCVGIYYCVKFDREKYGFVKEEIEDPTDKLKELSSKEVYRK